MKVPSFEGSDAGDERLVESIVTMLAVGVALGVLFNGLGLAGKPGWGIAWVGQDRAAAVPSLTALTSSPSSPSSPGARSPGAAGGVQGASDDPMAIDSGVGAGLPVIPELDRPIEAALEQVRQFHVAGAALFVDARDAEEFAVGHLAGAVSLPYDVAAGDPALLENLDTGGRPIVVYCGGEACELSMSLAYELIYAGHKRVLVYMGGYPEWEAAGYPTAAGESPGP